MKTTPVCLLFAAFLLGAFGISQPSNAEIIWSSGSGVNTNWSSQNNWSPNTTVPGPGDNVGFNNTAVVTSPTTINNVVDTDFSIAALQYSNFVASGSPNYHVTQITDGRTLTISTGLSVGVTNAGTGALVNGVITGPGGTLTTSGNLFVGQGSSGDGTHQAILDMSGLGTFNATISKMSIGTAAPSAGNGATRNSGVVYLARTNFVTVSGTGATNGVLINNNSNTGGTVGANKPSFLYLGQTNVFYADGIYAGAVKSACGALLAFNPTGLNSPVAYFRGLSGDTSRVSNWAIGSEQQLSGSNQNGTGTNDFTGGIIDALVNNLVLGVSAAGNSGGTSGNGTGLLTMGAGTMDVNNLTNGWSIGTGTAGDVGSGTINVGSGALKVNDNLVLAINTSTGTGLPVGIINVNGGTLQASNVIAGSGTSAINLTNATLILTNGVGSGTISTFAISNSVLTIPATGISGATIPAGAVAIGGSTNQINITSVPILASYPATLPLISYTALSGITNIGVGSFPAASPAFQGYITNDGSSSSINLVLTTGPALARALIWKGQLNSTWDADNTANWHTNGGPATTYHDFDFVTFDDTATSHTVSLAQTLIPSDIIISNNSTYTFNGGGALAGSTAVTKLGTGALILDETGNDTFSGGLAFSNCTVQIGSNDSGGGLGTGPVQNDGALVFSRANAGLTVSNIISGSGTITNNGSGSVTLSGANTFDGAVVINAGVLKANNNSALGTTNGATTIVGGALDVNGRNLGQEQIYVSGSGADGGAANGAIFNSGANASPAIARVTLQGNTVFGGSGRWDLRSATTSDANGASLSVSPPGSAYNLTKVGANQVSIVGVTVDTNLANVTVQSGILSIEAATTGLGNPASNLTVQSSATLQFFGMTNKLNKNIILQDGAIVNNASGNNTVVGPMTFNGTVTFNFGSGSLTLSNTLSGGGELDKNGTNTLVLAGPDNRNNGTQINDGTFILNNVHANNDTLYTIGTSVLGGNGTNGGAVLVDGAKLYPGISGTPSTFGAGSLQVGADNSPVTTFNLSSLTNAGSGINDMVNVTGNLVANGNLIYIHPLAALNTNGVYTLIRYGGTLTFPFNSTPQMDPAFGASRYQFSLNQGTGNNSQITLAVSGGPTTLEWKNTANNGLWDVNASQNWSNLVSAVSPDKFYNLDTVLLDDNITNSATPLTTVTIPSGTTVSPALLSVNATTNYTITGAGKITGLAALAKSGSNTLTILNATNDYTGSTIVSAGILAVSNNLALGAVSSTVFITNGGSLDISPNLANNGLNFGAKPFVVSGAGVGGNGAIVNNGTNQQNAFQNIALAGDTTFGGSTRWDIRGGTPQLSTGGNAWNVTKKGINQINWVDANVDTNLANIEIQSGMFGLQGALTSIGNPANTLTIWSNATLRVTDWANTLAKTLVLSNGAIVNNTSGTNTFGGPVALSGNVVLSIGGTSLTLTNTVGGSGGFIKMGGSPLNLTAPATYTGNTVVSNGVLMLTGSGAISSSASIILSTGTTLDVTARTNGILTLVSGQTLAGNGAVNGFAVANYGSIISPGTNTVIGKLAIASNATLSGTIVMKLNKSTSTNDVLAVGVNLVYGGTLSLSNLSTALTSSDQLKLFNAGTYSGAFTNIVPANPNNDPGLAWDTNSLTINGTLKLKTTATPTPRITNLNLNGTTLTIAATNGSAGGQYALLQSTNVALPLAQWKPVFTNNFDGSGNINLSTNIVNPANAQTFYILQVLP